MCKYCGKTCLNDICSNCMAEQNALLWHNDECVDLNSIFGLWGLFRFVSCIALIIVIISGFMGTIVGNLLWVAIIALAAATVLFHKLRKIFYNQLAIVIDREMRKNHS